MSNILSAKDYKITNWVSKFKDYNVSLENLAINNSWYEFFQNDNNKRLIKLVNNYLSDLLKKSNGKINIYPYPDLIFNALNLTPLYNVKVVIIGQDPYPKNEIIDGKAIPQAMGLSFSVPVGLSIPSSLMNIYKNLIKYNHISKIPQHGNLTFWAYQGCLMLNTSLTVEHGCPDSHSKYWTEFTDSLIKYISDKLDKIVFVLWGRPALQKIKLIDLKKHKTVISSHPSGLSCSKPLQNYKPFNDMDHFGEINKYLKENDKSTILFDII